MSTRRYTHDQVHDAVCAASEMVVAGFHMEDYAEDLLGLLANAVLALLDSPGRTLDEVIAVSYHGEPPPKFVLPGSDDD